MTERLIVWSKPNCQQCSATKRLLTKFGIPFADMQMSDTDIERFKAEGFLQAPVVETKIGKWGGFRPDLIKKLRDVTNG